jgi:hypothetical protein
MFVPTYQQACQIDSECSKVGSVKNGQFVPKLPPAHLMAYYGNLRPLILQIAKQYRIDPVTLVATPLAENTMNVRIKDAKLTDFVDSNVWKHTAEDTAAGSEEQVDENGIVVNPMIRAMYNRPRSVGPGQIYVSAAKHVEKLSAQIEGRTVLRSGKEIKHELFTPEGALRYAAAIIRDAQDRYAAAGYNISNRPEVLATLYNIGRVDSSISRTKEERRMPLPNYFGYWVAVNYRYLQAQFRLPSILDEAR